MDGDRDERSAETYMECQGCCTVYEASTHAGALAADGDKGYCGLTQRYEVQLLFSQVEDGWPPDADMVIAQEEN